MNLGRRWMAYAVTGVAAPLLALLVAVAGGHVEGFAPAAFAAAGLGLAVVPIRRRWVASLLVGGLAGGAAAALGFVLPLVAAATVHGLGISWLAPRLPEPTRGWRAWLWGALVVVMVANGARLTGFMADERFLAGAPAPFIQASSEHICMSAYVRAGELATRVPNVYDPGHYVKGAESTVAHLSAHIDDPYEYPPTFLVLPAAGLGLSNDFLLLRAGWYAIQALLIGAMLLVVARWIGGEEGRRVGLLLPVLWTAAPMMFDFQYGQVHMLVIGASVTAMVAFERRHHAVGGALLGAAIAAKLTPGLLLVYLLARRRWSAAAWTGLAVAAYAVVSLLVVGPQPAIAFVKDHLPRLQSGEAFAFFENGRDVVANNVSIYGVIFKLRMLGVPGMTRALASQLAWVYTLVLLVVAWLAGRRRPSGDRGTDVRSWLALANLAALRSPLAPALYVGAGTVWMIVLLAAAAQRRGWRLSTKVFLGWLFAGATPPLPTDLLAVLASVPTLFINVLTNAWPLASAARAPRPASPSPQDSDAPAES